MSYRSSASQVSTFELCPRKWAFKKIEQVPDPGNRFSSLGKEVHALLEAWFTSGEVPDHETRAGRIARAILTQLPPPQTPGIEVEQEIRTSLGGVPFKGFVDLRILEGRDVPFVSDHKTTSGLQWAKSPDDLVSDVAATIYAADAMSATMIKTADLQWTYATTRGKTIHTLPVCRRVTFDEILPRLEKTANAARTMREIFEAKPKALEVPYDAAGCEAFGGCPYRDRCNLTATERIRSVMTQETEHSNFLKKLRAKRGDNGAQAPTPHPAPAEPAPVPTTAGTINPTEAPAVVAPSPPPEKPKGKTKGKRKRRTKAEMQAARAAQAAAEDVDTAVAKDNATPAEQAAATALGAPVKPPSSPSKAVAGTRAVPSPPPVTAAPSPPQGPAIAGDLLSLLNRQFVEGFKAGVAAAKDLGK